MEQGKYYIDDNGRCVIPEGVTEIEERAFKGCTSLRRVYIPDSVTKIGIDAFNGCTSLKNIDIPNSVVEIGMDAFSYCTSLENVNIHLCRLREISVGVFNGCKSLKAISLPFMHLGRIRLAAFHRCTSLKSIDIPDGVTQIDGSFLGCTFLESVSIPESVRFINNTSFDGCPSLKDIHLRIKHLNNVDIQKWSFDENAKAHGTLYVPVCCIQECREHEELGQFKNIEIEPEQHP